VAKTRSKIRDKIAVAESALQAQRGSSDNWIACKDSDVGALIKQLWELSDDFNDWESDFFASVAEFAEAHFGVTPRQYDVLVDLCDKYG